MSSICAWKTCCWFLAASSSPRAILETCLLHRLLPVKTAALWLTSVPKSTMTGVLKRREQSELRSCSTPFFKVPCSARPKLRLKVLYSLSKRLPRAAADKSQTRSSIQTRATCDFGTPREAFNTRLMCRALPGSKALRLARASQPALSLMCQHAWCRCHDVSPHSRPGRRG